MKFNKVEVNEENKAAESLEDVEDAIRYTRIKIERLKSELAELHRKRADVLLAPFKIGEDVIVKRIKMCGGAGYSENVRGVLECGGILDDSVFFRPYNKYGELYKKHYLLAPIGDQTYQDLLKKVE